MSSIYNPKKHCFYCCIKGYICNFNSVVPYDNISLDSSDSSENEGGFTWRCISCISGRINRYDGKNAGANVIRGLKELEADHHKICDSSHIETQQTICYLVPLCGSCI